MAKDRNVSAASWYHVAGKLQFPPAEYSEWVLVTSHRPPIVTVSIWVEVPVPKFSVQPVIKLVPLQFVLK